jgi:NADP-reducing hydrogenase subunit HndC
MKAPRALVLVSNDPISLSFGSEEVFQALQAEIRARRLEEEIKVSTISDIAPRNDLPLVMIYPEGVVYGPVNADDVKVLVEEHLLKGQIVRSLVGRMHEPVGEIAWLRARSGVLPVQQRVVLGRVGLVDPESLDDYLIHDGYVA